jgi:hypothetical protein
VSAELSDAAGIIVASVMARLRIIAKRWRQRPDGLLRAPILG